MSKVGKIREDNDLLRTEKPRQKVGSLRKRRGWFGVKVIRRSIRLGLGLNVAKGPGATMEAEND